MASRGGRYQGRGYQAGTGAPRKAAPNGSNSTAPPAAPPSSASEGRKHHETFQVLLQDMGLDFKSYQGLTRSDSSTKAISNQFVLNADEIISVTEPTLGLLILILHSAQQCAQTTTSMSISWLRLYRQVQEHIVTTYSATPAPVGATPGQPITSHANHSKILEVAQTTVKYLDSVVPWDQQQQISAFTRREITDIVMKLFVNLDEQSGLRGQNQSPSCRRIQNDPKGMLCNLALSTAPPAAGANKGTIGCQQGFLCNQVHILPHKGWENRSAFFNALCQALQERGLRDAEVRHRVKDAIFFARYGNKVSLKTQGGHVIFFKTSYTKGRLLHALGTAPARYCASKGNAAMCIYGELCEGVHVGDPHSVYTGKPSEPLDATIHEELEKEVTQYASRPAPLAFLEVERRIHGPGHVTASPASTPGVSNERKWNEFLHNPVTGHDHKGADPQLVQRLTEGVSASPALSRSDSSTPLLDEIDKQVFDEKQDSTDG